MRSLVVAIGLLAFAATADAKPKKPAPTKTSKKTAPTLAKTSGREPRDNREKSAKKRGKGKRVAHARERTFEFRGPVHGQSLGAPWAGRLRDATQFPDGEGYHIRRPWRSYGTKSTVEAVFHVIGAVREKFPDVHVLAIGSPTTARINRVAISTSASSTTRSRRVTPTALSPRTRRTSTARRRTR
jgi:hypothetical protein